MKKKLFILLISALSLFADVSEQKKLAYIVSDTSIPFWQIMAKGIVSNSKKLGYEVTVYNSNNSLKEELKSTMEAIKNNVDGIIISPANSSSCSTVLKFVKQANIPVVISDIGTDSGEYVSYISSDNYKGAYKIGKILTDKMIEMGYQNSKVGIIAIPQKRLNGQERTLGFLKALKESDIKSADIRQQVDFSEKETYDLTKELIENNSDIKAIWLQGSDKYKGALNAISDTNNTNNILLLTFDAEPEFIDLIPKGALLASAMQQPYLMGVKSIDIMNDFLNKKDVQKNIKLPVLAISTDNINNNLPTIKKYVLGLDNEFK